MIEPPNLENIDDLVFFGNRALWGEIRPNIRRVAVEYIKDEKRLVLYLYYDKPMTQEELDYDVPGTILAELISDFPVLGVKWDDQVIVLPYPQKLPGNGICIFRRYEPCPPEE